MVLDESEGIYRPEIVDPKITGKGVEFAVCPGKGVPLRQLAREVFGAGKESCLELGTFETVVAARSTNEEILAAASSGGVMTAIAAYLLETGRVDGVLTSVFSHDGKGPRTQTIIARSLQDLFKGQGSKYCPTTTNQMVAECVRKGGKYLFIGTPCQVAALRLAMRQDASLKAVFPLNMANFCGGYRDFRDLDAMITRHGMNPAQTQFFRFRGGGQPGSMLIVSQDGRKATEPFPDYGRHSTQAKQKRCTFCIDGTGELADFACGDAWLPRFASDSKPWSIVLTRSPLATEVFHCMVNEHRIVTQPVTRDEVITSQRHNLDSKKFRQFKRVRVCSALGMMLPEWDTPLPSHTGSYAQEIRILLGKLKSRILGSV